MGEKFPVHSELEENVVYGLRLEQGPPGPTHLWVCDLRIWEFSSSEYLSRQQFQMQNLRFPRKNSGGATEWRGLGPVPRQGVPWAWLWPLSTPSAIVVPWIRHPCFLSKTRNALKTHWGGCWCLWKVKCHLWGGRCRAGATGPLTSLNFSPFTPLLQLHRVGGWGDGLYQSHQVFYQRVCLTHLQLVGSESRNRTVCRDLTVTG